jgi:hypothetical protein
MLTLHDDLPLDREWVSSWKGAAADPHAASGVTRLQIAVRRGSVWFRLWSAPLNANETFTTDRT